MEADLNSSLQLIVRKGWGLNWLNEWRSQQKEVLFHWKFELIDILIKNDKVKKSFNVHGWIIHNKIHMRLENFIYVTWSIICQNDSPFIDLN